MGGTAGTAAREHEPDSGPLGSRSHPGKGEREKDQYPGQAHDPKDSKR